jgi:hypothetical protein
VTHIVAVSTTVQRDTLISNIRQNLENRKGEQPNIEVVQPSLNKIQVYHKAAPDTRVLIKTILVVVIQVHMNLAPLTEVYDETILYDLHEVFKVIDCYKEKLNKIKNTTSRGRGNNEKYSKLVSSLSDTTAEY